MNYQREPDLVGLTVTSDGKTIEHPQSQETRALLRDAIFALEDLAQLAWTRKETPNPEDGMTADDYEWYARDRYATASKLRDLIGMPYHKPSWKTKTEIFGTHPSELKTPQMR